MRRSFQVWQARVIGDAGDDAGQNADPAAAFSPKRSRMAPINKKLDYSAELQAALASTERNVFDTHCHLDLISSHLRRAENEEDKEERVETNNLKSLQQRFPSRFANFEGCLAVYCFPRFWWTASKVRGESNVFLAFGVHPHMAAEYSDGLERSLEHLLKNTERCVALGEIGLDYSENNSCTKETQINVFKRQLLLGIRLGLPLCLHVRGEEAQQDARDAMQQVNVPADYRFHLHCLTCSHEEQLLWTKSYSECKVGFTSIITWRSSDALREVVARTPLNRILIETDAPYLAPAVINQNEEKYGRVSLPGDVVHVAAMIAHLKGIPVSKVLQKTRNNAAEVYGPMDTKPVAPMEQYDFNYLRSVRGQAQNEAGQEE